MGEPESVNIPQREDTESNITRAGDYIPSNRFEGQKKGFVFKMGNSGLGYYKDDVSISERSENEDGHVNREGEVEGKVDSINAAATSSYYHFDSKGKKFKSKWDKFDADSELKKLECDDKAKDSEKPSKRPEEAIKLDK